MTDSTSQQLQEANDGHGRRHWPRGIVIEKRDSDDRVAGGDKRADRNSIAAMANVASLN